ncbi:MAG: hypothetical protein ACK4N5_11860 [Myxococcales bacterium]
MAASLVRFVLTTLSAARRLGQDESGQAMAEYSMISFYLILGTGGCLFVWIPSMLNAYQVYIQGFYLVLGLPVP